MLLERFNIERIKFIFLTPESSLGNLVLNYAELVDYYTTHNLHHFVALLHAKFMHMERACAVWSQLVRGQPMEDINFPGLEYFCQRLASLREEEEELVWSHADSCLEK
jgi:hypothetical protein